MNENSASPTGTSSAKLSKEVQDELRFMKARVAKLKIEEYELHTQINVARRSTKLISERRAMCDGERGLRTAHRERRAEMMQQRKKAVEQEKTRHSEAIQQAKHRVQQQKEARKKELQQHHEMLLCLENIRRAEEREKVIKLHEVIHSADASARKRHDIETSNRLQLVREAMREEVDRDAAERAEKKAMCEKLTRQQEELMRRVEELRGTKKQVTESRNQSLGTASGPSSPHRASPPRSNNPPQQQEKQQE